VFSAGIVVLHFHVEPSYVHFDEAQSPEADWHESPELHVSVYVAVHVQGWQLPMLQYWLHDAG